LLASSDGRRIYVVDMGGDTVATIDTAARALSGAPVPVGFSPYGAAVSGGRLLVTNEGLMRYGVLPALAPAPPFAAPASDLADASSLSLLALDDSGRPVAGGEPVPMDPAPDGVRIAGGAHPTAIVTTADGAYAFVAMTNVDRIATVALGAAPHVAGGTELRLFDRGPYGTQPTALALSHDGSRLYVALGGLDAIAVIDARDPLHLHRLGLIPTGWAPSALALSSDDRTLFVANQMGYGHDAGADWSTLERIDLAEVRLADATRAALGATRRVVPLPAPLPKAVRDVVLIVEDGKTYDELLGDLGAGPGAPGLARYGASVTPNLHALARRFALAGNLFAGSDDVGVAQQIVAGGLATAFAQRTASAGAGRRPLGYENEDPEDAPRLGGVFNELARHGLSFRDYGGFLGVSGTAVAAAAAAPGGLDAAFGQDVPAPAVLAGNVDLNYPVRDAAVPDTVRAAEFVRDYGALIQAHRPPRFAYVALPGGDGTGASVADGDRALGSIVDFLSHGPAWHTTAIFVVAADPGGGDDHVDASRTFALVVSPWAKRGYLGMRHLSTASVLKTIDRIFDLPALSLGDLLAQDMGDFFTAQPDRRPYEGAPPPADNDSARGEKRSP
jgi:YVTN family beta-propeller protein